MWKDVSFETFLINSVQDLRRSKFVLFTCFYSLFLFSTNLSFEQHLFFYPSSKWKKLFGPQKLIKIIDRIISPFAYRSINHSPYKINHRKISAEKILFTLNEIVYTSFELSVMLKMFSRKTFNVLEIKTSNFKLRFYIFSISIHFPPIYRLVNLFSSFHK